MIKGGSNSIAPMFLTAQLIDLIKQNEADIIKVGSTVVTKQGYYDQIAYTTSKWAIRGISYNLQLNGWNQGILQN